MSDARQLTPDADEDSPVSSEPADADGEDAEHNHVQGAKGLPQQRSRVRLPRAGSLGLRELTTSTTGTASGSGKLSQSPGVSEAGGEEAGMQGLDHLNACQPKALKRGKRKLPTPDLDAIEDEEERRRQRRLVKNRNTAAASRVRKQQQMEALSQRMHEVEQDNASLRGLVDSRNAEIMRLRQVIRSMCGGGAPENSSSETPPLPPNALSAHPEWYASGARHVDEANEASLGQALDRKGASLAQSGNSPYQLHGSSPMRRWDERSDLLDVPPNHYSQQQMGCLYLAPPLPKDQFAQRLGFPLGQEDAAQAGQERGAAGASAVTASLNTSQQSALASPRDQQLTQQRCPPDQALHMRGGGGGARADAAHADFLDFPWPEVMEMSERQHMQQQGDAQDQQ